MDTNCGKLMGIFKDQNSVKYMSENGYRITFIGKDVEALMNRMVNPTSDACKYGEMLKIVYMVTKVSKNACERLPGSVEWHRHKLLDVIRSNTKTTTLVTASDTELMAVDTYHIEEEEIHLISGVPQERTGSNPMYMPTLAAMGHDLIEQLVHTVTLSYTRLPYMNLHESPITIPAKDNIIGTSSDTMMCMITRQDITANGHKKLKVRIGV